MYCCTADGVAPLTPPLPSKLNLEGFSLEEPTPITSLLHLTTLLSSLVMTSYASSGRQKKSPKEQANLLKSIQHFQENHSRSEGGHSIVPLPRNSQSQQLGESRPQAVRRFLSLKWSLYSTGKFQEFSDIIEDNFNLSHAEPIPSQDLQKPPQETFYLPMHAVRIEHSTTKVRVVFDTSTKSTSGVLLNDTLLVRPTIYPLLIDMLIRFCSHRVALTADVSKMSRAVEFVLADRDLHRFVWRKSVKYPLRDCRMTRVTFGSQLPPSLPTWQ